MLKSLNWGICLVIAVGCGTPEARRKGDVVSHELEAAPRVVYESIPVGLPEWQVDREPLFRVGSAEGLGADVFGSISSVAFRSDGGVVVADGMTLQVKTFGSSGEHQWTFGRAGSGPGEFVSLAFAGVISGDTVLAFGSHGSGYAISPEGVLARRITLSNIAGMGAPEVRAVLRNGRIIATLLAPLSPAEQRAPSYRGRQTIVMYDADGVMVSQIMDEMPVGDYVGYTGADGRALVRRISPELARGTEIAAGADAFVVGVQDSFQILRFDGEGRVRDVIEGTWKPSVFDAGAQRRYREDNLALTEHEEFPSEFRRAARQAIMDEFLPDWLPAFGRVLLDPEDQLWVEEFQLGPIREVSRWWVFADDGQVVARVTISQRLRVEGIWRDLVVMSGLDPMGHFPYLEVRKIGRGQ